MTTGTQPTLPPPTTAPAGWYPDPWTGGLRYFDGHRWLDRWSSPVSLRHERGPHPTLPVRAAFGALVILVGSLISGRLLIEVLADRGWPLVLLVAVLAVVGYGPSLAWCWWVSRRLGTGRWGDDVGLRFRWADLGWGPLSWLAMLATQLVMVAVVVVADVPFASNTEAVSDADATRSYLVALLVTAVVAAPLVEEIVFRGVVLRGFLARSPAAVAIVAQGALFGLAHVDPSRGRGNIGLALVLGGVGVTLGVVAFVARRLGPTIVAHAIFNGVVMAVALSGVLDDVESPFDFDDASVVDAEAAVVDQPDLAEPHGHQHHRLGAIQHVE